MQGQKTAMSTQDAEDLNDIMLMLDSLVPLTLRACRALMYAISAYLLLMVQPHLTENHLVLVSAIFFLAIPRRTTLISEGLIALIAVSIFVPEGFTNFIN